MADLNRRGFLRASALTGAGLVTVGGLVACSRRSGEAEAADTASGITMQAAWVNDAEFIGYYVADSEGYYNEAGIQFTYLSGGPSVIPESTLLAGRADVSLTSPDTTIQSILADGSPFVIVGAQYQKNPIGVVSLVGNNINEPKDLVGKRLAVPDANRLSVEAMLKLNNVDQAAVTIVPYAFDPTPLIRGEVDATIDFVTNVPYTIEEAGAEPSSFLLYDYGFTIPNDTVVVTRETLESKRDTIVEWLRASRRGWDANFTDTDAYPPKYETTWFKDSGRSIANEQYFNRVQRDLIAASGGIFAMSDELIGSCIDSLGRIGLRADKSMFDTSLLTEL